MSKELVAKLRSGFITDACGVPLRGSTEKVMKEAADLIEFQAKELAECQARVVLLSEALERIAGFTPTSSELHAIASEALASTDTAAIVQKWQPIESAPKDAFILLWCPEDRSRWLAKWRGGRWYGVEITV